MKMKLNFLISLALLVGSYVECLSQITLVTPPSPEVERLFLFDHHPTELFTGLPTINLPIYDVSSGGITVPVSLSYNYSGYKPSDYDGRVGMGWILNQGGVVTRTVYGQPDDLPIHGLLNTLNPIFDVSTLQSRTKYEEYQYLHEVVDKNKDIKYDIFSYTASGKSNSFVLKKTSDGVAVVKLNSDKSTKVTPIFTTGTENLRGFEIVDNEGVRYMYGIGTENEDVCEYEDGVLTQQKTSWFLTHIVDKNTIDTIFFDYSELEHILVDDIYQNKFRTVYNLEQPNCIPTSGQVAYSDQNTSRSYRTRAPVKIRFRGGHLDFGYDGRHIDHIAVKNYNNESVKYFQFHYSPLKGARSYRLLDSISQLNGSTYRFDYNLPTNDALQGLHPSSLGRDWLGYYNGTTSFRGPHISDNQGTLGSSERSVNHISTKLFALKRLVYPTGGFVEFEWENNKAREGGQQIVEVPGLRIKAMSYNSVNGKKIREVYRYGDNEDGAGYVPVNYSSTSIVNMSTKAHITGKDVVPSPCSYLYQEMLSTSMFVPTSRNLSQNIYYTKVGKYLLNELNQYTGKEVYDYYLPEIHMDIDRSQYLARYWFDVPVRSRGNFSFPVEDSYITSKESVGQLKSKQVFRSENGIFTLIRQEKYSYGKVAGSELNFLRIARLGTYSGCVGGNFMSSVDYENKIANDISIGYDEWNALGHNANCQQFMLAPIYAYKQSAIRASFSFLQRKTISDYIKGDSVFREELYSYMDETPLLESIVERSSPYEGANFINNQSFVYGPVIPSYFIDPNNTIISSMMREKNFYAKQVISNSFFRNDSNELITSGDEANNTEYGIFSSNRLLPKYKFVTRTYNGPSSGGNYTNIIDDVTEIKIYDRYGNPLQTEQDSYNRCYLWGYNGQYPVAKIENATYDEVKLVLTQAAIDNLNLASHTEVAMETLIRAAGSKLRNDTRLARAKVTVYTYKPLVGMTSKTDPRGITEYYRYDGFQRLKDVLDFDKNVLKSHQYHYRP